MLSTTVPSRRPRLVAWMPLRQHLIAAIHSFSYLCSKFILLYPTVPQQPQ